MKHPALTRVLSAALAIMCVIMLAAGAVGLGKAESQYDDDTADYEKLTGRVTLYKELDEKLKNGTTYKEDSERLDAAQKQHDKRPSTAWSWPSARRQRAASKWARTRWHRRRR